MINENEEIHKIIRNYEKNQIENPQLNNSVSEMKNSLQTLKEN